MIQGRHDNHDTRMIKIRIKYNIKDPRIVLMIWFNEISNFYEITMGFFKKVYDLSLVEASNLKRVDLKIRCSNDINF